MASCLIPSLDPALSIFEDSPGSGNKSKGEFAYETSSKLLGFCYIGRIVIVVVPCRNSIEQSKLTAADDMLATNLVKRTQTQTRRKLTSNYFANLDEAAELKE